MRTTFLAAACTLTCWFAASSVDANNIQVSNTTLVDNTGSDVMVQFDISWENSWRGGGVSNWDAAWVFVKFKYSNGLWKHARLATSGHVAPGGSLIDLGLLTPGAAADPVSNPAIGVFIRRDADGTGTFTANGVQLKWDYATQGILAYNDIAEVRVFAVEMVYANQGAFFLGSGGDEPGHFNLSGPSNLPVLVNSENAINMSSTGFNLWADDFIEAGTLPAAFPKGFAASYAMKYEMSQAQYTDFLNTLTRTQQEALVGSLPTGTWNTWYVMSGVWDAPDYRNTISVSSNPSLPEGALHFNGGTSCRAMNYLNWFRLTAYLDWAGLRPMTELEFEKLCRGALPSLPGEYAWGSDAVSSTSFGTTTGTVFTLSGTSCTESIETGFSSSSGNMNAIHLTSVPPNIRGPVRVGIFAAHPSSTGRMTAGAGYFGAMELSGNVFEGTVSLATATGRVYTGVHGDGEITTSGSANVSNWPTSTGAGWRGGSFYTPTVDPLSDHPTSSRSRCNGVEPVIEGLGGRGVRTAP